MRTTNKLLGGIAVLIASTQIKDFFGLNIPKPPSEFLARMEAIGSNFGSISITTTVSAGRARPCWRSMPISVRRLKLSLPRFATNCFAIPLD